MPSPPNGVGLRVNAAINRAFPHAHGKVEVFEYRCRERGFVDTGSHDDIPAAARRA